MCEKSWPKRAVSPVGSGSRQGKQPQHLTQGSQGIHKCQRTGVDGSFDEGAGFYAGAQRDGGVMA